VKPYVHPQTTHSTQLDTYSLQYKMCVLIERTFQVVTCQCHNDIHPSNNRLAHVLPTHYYVEYSKSGQDKMAQTPWPSAATYTRTYISVTPHPYIFLSIHIFSGLASIMLSLLRRNITNQKGTTNREKTSSLFQPQWPFPIMAKSLSHWSWEGMMDLSRYAKLYIKWNDFSDMITL